MDHENGDNESQSRDGTFKKYAVETEPLKTTKMLKLSTAIDLTITERDTSKVGSSQNSHIYSSKVICSLKRRRK